MNFRSMTVDGIPASDYATESDAERDGWIVSDVVDLEDSDGRLTLIVSPATNGPRDDGRDW